LRQISEVIFAQSILGRGLADHRAGDHREALGELRRKSLDKKVGIAFAVIDKAEALAPNIRQPPRCGN
jgi:hypothetical protein